MKKYLKFTFYTILSKSIFVCSHSLRIQVLGENKKLHEKVDKVVIFQLDTEYLMSRGSTKRDTERRKHLIALNKHSTGGKS